MTSIITSSHQDKYNKYTEYPRASYNIIKYLIANNDLLFRLLKYPDAKAFRLDADHPNLTLEEKNSMLYNGIDPETDFNLFIDLRQDDAWTKQFSFIRIAPSKLVPTNYVYGYMPIVMIPYTHFKINTMINGETRLDRMTQQLIETLNGAEIPDVGQLFFDARASRECQMTLTGSIPYSGNVLVMCNHQLG